MWYQIWSPEQYAKYVLHAFKGRIVGPTDSSSNIPRSLYLLISSIKTRHAWHQNESDNISRILCTYITCLSPMLNVVPEHILHAHSSKVWYILPGCAHEKGSQTLGHGGHAHSAKLFRRWFSIDKILSGGDQPTCEQQSCDGHIPCDML